jgi:hypothetical protein
LVLILTCGTEIPRGFRGLDQPPRTLRITQESQPGIPLAYLRVLGGL